MASLVRTIQKRILRKRNVQPVPVYGRGGRATLMLTIIGRRLPLHPSHVGYHADGTPVPA